MQFKSLVSASTHTFTYTDSNLVTHPHYLSVSFRIHTQLVNTPFILLPAGLPHSAHAHACMYQLNRANISSSVNEWSCGQATQQTYPQNFQIFLRLGTSFLRLWCRLIDLIKWSKLIKIIKKNRFTGITETQKDRNTERIPTSLWNWI